MWEVRTQFSKPAADSNTPKLEWSSVVCDTAEEAETWWQARTCGKSFVRRVHTMTDPEGVVRRVQFK